MAVQRRLGWYLLLRRIAGRRGRCRACTGVILQSIVGVDDTRGREGMSGQRVDVWGADWPVHGRVKVTVVVVSSS